MHEVKELEDRILKLPREALAELRTWFLELDTQIWDTQISDDFKAGKFDQLIKQAREELALGKVREL